VAKTTLYNQLITLTNDHFGLNSSLLIDSLIESHLQIAPKDINSQQLGEIHVWLETLVSLIASNKKLVDSYLVQLKSLEKSK